MKKKCEHLLVDGWHVPTQEARELARAASERRYGWRDQIRAEMSGEVSRWMWPGLLLLLLAGLYLRDWLLVTGAVAALFFFLYQAFSLVRTLGAGRAVTAVARDIHLVEANGDDEIWGAPVRLDDQPQEVIVTCPEGISALQHGKALELMVVVDPDDAGNNWLVGFRTKQ